MYFLLNLELIIAALHAARYLAVTVLWFWNVKKLFLSFLNRPGKHLNQIFVKQLSGFS